MNTHPLFQQKLDVYEALRARTAAASAEARSKCRFYVEPHAGGWGVVSTATKRLHGQCKNHKEAVQYAEQLERAVDKKERSTSLVKDVADRIFRWALIIGLALLGLALWGAR
jgi:hypothetical protein